jgi:hypothetical protein
MTKAVGPRSEYHVPERWISGTHDEKMEQIDQAIQELLDVKRLECADRKPAATFLAVPRRTHWVGMTVTLLLLMVLLILLLETRQGPAPL